MNTVTLTGRAGGDIEVRASGGGGYVGRFSLAEARLKKEGAGAAQRQDTVWHQVVVFGMRAARLRKVVTKGRLLLVSGQLGYSEWTDKNGGRHRDAQIELHGPVGSIEFLDRPKRVAAGEVGDELEERGA
jgi:single-strand DNA-binding protein